MSGTDTPILHVDMDAFYASIESREEPSLRGVPLAVGGDGARGVVMSASYEARAFGVRSAMPSVRAKRLCPDLVFVPPNFTRYQRESEEVLAIFFSFTPLVEQLSLDEAFLDVSGAARLFGEPYRIAERIRELVRAKRGLVCSVGIAPNKFLAKLASEKAKPDGIVLLRPGDVRAFLDALPVEDIWGVGEQTAAAIRRLGARSVAELRSLPRAALVKSLGAGPAEHLLALSDGRDERTVVVSEPAKQVSAEETFDRDIDAPQDIRRELLRLAGRVAARLREGGVAARTITVKIRLANFKTLTRSRTIPEPTTNAVRMAGVAAELFASARLERPRIRLLGIAGTNLISGPAPVQLRFGSRSERWPQADRAVDRLRERFGSEAVELAAIAPRRPKRIPRSRGPRGTVPAE
jgi:DNA polymerase IV